MFASILPLGFVDQCWPHCDKTHRQEIHTYITEGTTQTNSNPGMFWVPAWSGGWGKWTHLILHLSIDMLFIYVYTLILLWYFVFWLYFGTMRPISFNLRQDFVPHPRHEIVASPDSPKSSYCCSTEIWLFQPRTVVVPTKSKWILRCVKIKSTSIFQSSDSHCLVKHIKPRVFQRRNAISSTTLFQAHWLLQSRSDKLTA